MSYGTATPLDPRLVTAHCVALSGLTAGTLYHYRVKSRDAAGNLGTSADQTVTTAAAADSMPPTVSLTPPASGTTASSIIIVSSEERRVGKEGRPRRSPDH